MHGDNFWRRWESFGCVGSEYWYPQVSIRLLLFLLNLKHGFIEIYSVSLFSSRSQQMLFVWLVLWDSRDTKLPLQKETLQVISSNFCNSKSDPMLAVGRYRLIASITVTLSKIWKVGCLSIRYKYTQVSYIHVYNWSCSSAN